MNKDLMRQLKELKKLTRANLEWSRILDREQKTLDGQKGFINSHLKQAYLEAKEIKKKARGQADKIQDEKAYYIETRDKINKEHKVKQSELDKTIKHYKNKNDIVKSLFQKFTKLNKELKEKDHLLSLTKSFLSSEQVELKARKANLDMRIDNAHELVKKLEQDGLDLKEKKEGMNNVAKDLLEDKHRIEKGLAHMIQTKQEIEKEKALIAQDKEEVRLSKLTAKEMSNENKAELTKIAKERDRLRIDIRRLDKRLKEARKLNAK